MHMSSACPWGRTPGQPGEYIQGDELASLPLGKGKIRDIVLSSKERGGGIRNFVKFTDANQGDMRGICRFPQPINTGDTKGVKRSETKNTRFRADALHNIILEPVFRYLYSIVLIFCNKDI